MGKLAVTGLVKKIGALTIVDDLTLTVEDGELLTIVGPSGCGKTTLLRMVAGFLEPTAGKIMIDDDVVSDRPGNRISVAPENRDIGMVFQSYAVWSHMDVFANVAYPLKLRKIPKEEMRERTLEVLKMVHLDGYEERMPYELSGGQQQRVALARALVMRPRLLLLDEPLSNLDAALREEMRGEIKEIQRKTGITIVNVTHDRHEAMTMSDKVAIMDSGRLIQFGTPRELYEHPVNTFVAKFLGSANVLAATTEKGAKSSKSGMMEVQYLDRYRQEVPFVETTKEEGHLVFRPQDVVHDDASTIRPQVVRVLYLGNLYDYTLQFESGERIRMLGPTDREYALGEEVPIRITHAIWLDT